MTQKSERNEFSNKTEGRLIGGAIMVLIGSMFLLRQYNIVDVTILWPIFPLAIGALLILKGLSRYQKTESIEKSLGLFIGGTCMIFFSLGRYINIIQWWPILTIGIGLTIILEGRR